MNRQLPVVVVAYVLVVGTMLAIGHRSFQESSVNLVEIELSNEISYGYSVPLMDAKRGCGSPCFINELPEINYSITTRRCDNIPTMIITHADGYTTKSLRDVTIQVPGGLDSQYTLVAHEITHQATVFTLQNALAGDCSAAISGTGLRWFFSNTVLALKDDREVPNQLDRLSETLRNLISDPNRIGTNLVWPKSAPTPILNTTSFDFDGNKGFQYSSFDFDFSWNGSSLFGMPAGTGGLVEQLFNGALSVMPTWQYDSDQNGLAVKKQFQAKAVEFSIETPPPHAIFGFDVPPPLE